MKKLFLLFLLIASVSLSSFAQSAGKGSGERSEGTRKPRKQMRHFEKRKKDPNMKHNGTSYRKNRRSKYKVDGDGFSSGSSGKRRGRSKKTGVE
jgi:hypothetical protein